jgi:hypothetical protein
MAVERVNSMDGFTNHGGACREHHIHEGYAETLLYDEVVVDGLVLGYEEYLV